MIPRTARGHLAAGRVPVEADMTFGWPLPEEQYAFW